MSRRTYGQYCGLANALDLVGERWTLLIVRDLAVGPQRFTDVLEALPGIGTSLLSERLHRLEDSGIVERAVAERPAAGVIYRLTQEGEALARAVVPITLWGARRLGRADHAQFRPDWLMFTLRSVFRSEASAGIHDCYELRVEGVTAWVVVDDGSITVTQQRPRKPDFVLTADVPTLAAIGTGQLKPEEAIESGLADFEGSVEAGMRALSLLGLTDRSVQLPRRRRRPKSAASRR